MKIYRANRKLLLFEARKIVSKVIAVTKIASSNIESTALQFVKEQIFIIKKQL